MTQPLLPFFQRCFPAQALGNNKARSSADPSFRSHLTNPGLRRAATAGSLGVCITKARHQVGAWECRPVPPPPAAALQPHICLTFCSPFGVHHFRRSSAVGGGRGGRGRRERLRSLSSPNQRLSLPTLSNSSAAAVGERLLRGSLHSAPRGFCGLEKGREAILWVIVLAAAGF